MFFLKTLPSARMVEGYAGAYNVSAETIIDALTLMRRASQMIRRLESFFSSHGLSQLRFLFLIVIDREPDRDRLTVGEITDRLDVAGPVVARTLRVLEANGYVTSHKDEDDARTKQVRLTPKAHTLLKRLLPDYFAILADEMGRSE